MHAGDGGGFPKLQGMDAPVSDKNTKTKRLTLTEDDTAIFADVFSRLDLDPEARAEFLSACRFYVPRTEELEAQGVSNREAARQAARESGNVYLVRIVCDSFN